MRLVAVSAVVRVMGMVGRGDERVREMTIDLLRPGDELYWTDGTTYRQGHVGRDNCGVWWP